MARPIGSGATVGFALALAVLVANGVVSYLSARRLVGAERSVASSYEVQAELEGLLTTLTDAETGQRGYLITGERRYLEPYETAAVRAHAHLGRLRDLIADPAPEHDPLAGLESSIRCKLAELHEAVALRDGVGGFQAARDVVLTDRGKVAMDDIRRSVGGLQQAEAERLRRRTEEARSGFGWAVGSTVVAAVIALGSVVLAYSLMRRDLLGRARAEAAVLQQRELLRVTLASIGDGVIATDLDGLVTFLNPVAEQLTAWTEAEAVGQPLGRVFHIFSEISRRPSPSPAAHAIETGRVVALAGRTVLVARDGTEVPVDDSAAPIRDAEGRLLGAVLVFRDGGALRRADRRRAQFIAVLAHELRGPLAPVRNTAHALRMLGQANPQLAEMAGLIERQTQLIGRLVDDLLDLSRIGQGKITLRLGRVPLADAVRQAVETVRPVCDRKGQPLTVALPETPVVLKADLVRLVQVFTNLLTNASKYTDEGGGILLTGTSDVGWAEVRVRDSGVGIPTEVLPRVFDLFEQAGAHRERSDGGLGIGLAVVKGLVELHGGSVEARSDGPGKGSEFIVRLPLMRPEEPAQA
jgi:PAS domain S-box-containing protein